MTVGQSSNPSWSLVRKYRLTASNFGRVLDGCKRNSYPPSLYKTLFGKIGFGYAPFRLVPNLTYCTILSARPFHIKHPPPKFATFGKCANHISLHIDDLGNAHPPVSREYVQGQSRYLLESLCQLQRDIKFEACIDFWGFIWLIVRNFKYKLLLIQLQHEMGSLNKSNFESPF